MGSSVFRLGAPLLLLAGLVPATGCVALVCFADEECADGSGGSGGEGGSGGAGVAAATASTGGGGSAECCPGPSCENGLCAAEAIEIGATGEALALAVAGSSVFVVTDDKRIHRLPVDFRTDVTFAKQEGYAVRSVEAFEQMGNVALAATEAGVVYYPPGSPMGHSCTTNELVLAECDFAEASCASRCIGGTPSFAAGDHISALRAGEEGVQFVAAQASGIHAVSLPLASGTNPSTVAVSGGVDTKVRDFARSQALACRTTSEPGAALECTGMSPASPLVTVHDLACHGRVVVRSERAFYSCPAASRAYTWRDGGRGPEPFGPPGTGEAIGLDEAHVYLSSDGGLLVCDVMGSTVDAQCFGPVGAGEAPVASIDASDSQYVFFLRGRRLFRWTKS